MRDCCARFLRICFGMPLNPSRVMGRWMIETDVVDHFVVIRVKDTGVGISAEAQAKLFEPFFTTKAQGTGLGLATSQQIIFEHNGHLLVESQPGRGPFFPYSYPYDNTKNSCDSRC